MFLLVFCADKWAIILTALPVSEQLKILRWQCPMLPIRGESDSWRASHLSTLPPKPTFPSLFSSALAPRSSTILLFSLSLSSVKSPPSSSSSSFPLSSPGEGGLSPLQITNTKRRWWRRWCWELPVQGPVSINETMKVYFARMHVLNSFLCDSWLGNVSVNLIKDSAGSHYFLSTPVPDGVKVHHLHPWLVRGAAPAPEQAPFSFPFFFSPLSFFFKCCLFVERSHLFTNIPFERHALLHVPKWQRCQSLFKGDTHFYKTDLDVHLTHLLNWAGK